MRKANLQKLVFYAQDTGQFYSLSPGRYFGKPIGWINSDGYVEVKLPSGSYRAHRLAFLWMLGTTPEQIDHKDTVRSNNAWDNLRACTSAQNAANASGKGNKSGHKNISLLKGGLTWQVKFQSKGKTYWKNLPSLEEAILWRNSKLSEINGDFANTRGHFAQSNGPRNEATS